MHITPDYRRKVQAEWHGDLRDLDKYGPPHRFSSRKLAGLYAVASISYHGNDEGLISDEAFDMLCHWLLEHYDECVRSGADKLDRELLKCCTGHEVYTFVKPYHDIVAMLLNHACRCMACIAPPSLKLPVNPTTDEAA